MKRVFLSAGIILSGIFFSVSHVKAQEGAQIGIEATPHFSWLINSDDRDNASYENLGTVAGSFGVSGQYGFTDNHAIGLNVLYSYQGQRFKLNAIERYKNVEYIKIPLMYVYSFGLTENVRFIGKIGPQLDILTNASLLDEDLNDIVDDQTDAYENVALDVVGSAGLGFMLNDSWSLDASVRYDIGLTDAEDSGYSRSINDPIRSARAGNRSTTSNSTLGVTVGLRYTFGAMGTMNRY